MEDYTASVSQRYRARAKRTVVVSRAVVAASIVALLVGCKPAFAEDVSAKAMYLDYHKALLAAKDVNTIEPFMCKSVCGEIDSTPAEAKTFMFAMIKATVPKVVEVVSEKIDGEHGEHAFLTLKVGGSPAISKNADGDQIKEETAGTVTLLKEEGVWKIQKESWSSKLQVGGELPVPPTAPATPTSKI